MTERTQRLSRRRFLLVAGTGGALAAAAIVARNASPVQPASPGPDKRATRGYQASAHVNHYYRTAKV
jgi:hypothetical protein